MIGVAPCLPFGRGIFTYDYGFLPNRRPIVTVVGKAIPVIKNENPSDQEVAEYQEKYIAALTEIYNKYKDEFASDRIRDMKIIR